MVLYFEFSVWSSTPLQLQQAVLNLKADYLLFSTAFFRALKTLALSSLLLLDEEKHRTWLLQTAL